MLIHGVMAWPHLLVLIGTQEAGLRPIKEGYLHNLDLNNLSMPSLIDGDN